ncbi:MAG: hypothetical protein ABIX01_12885 [Chitinophagaceae bacterium]
MLQKKPEVDVIMDVLKGALEAFPAAPFLQSLNQQYQDRGFLTKKQLEGLYSKASKATNIAVGKMATLEAIILQLPERQKSLPRFPTPLYKKDAATGSLISAILYKHPQHKAALMYKNKYDNNIPLTPAELAELQRFHKVLVS